MKIDLALLKKIHRTIAMKRTGGPDLMSKELGISKRYLHEILSYMKSEFEAPILYSRIGETYYYSEEWELYIGDLNRVKSKLLKAVVDTLGYTQ